MTELKPCPFCGGNGIEEYIYFPDEPPSMRIICGECQKAATNYMDVDKAINAWNTRYEPTCKLTDIDMYTGEIQLGKFECSACGNTYLGEPYRHCPNCGAEVIEE